MSHAGNVANFFSRFVLSVRWCISWVSKTLRNAFENFFKSRGPLCVRCHFAPELTLRAKYFDLACSRAFILYVFPNAFFIFSQGRALFPRRKSLAKARKGTRPNFWQTRRSPKLAMTNSSIMILASTINHGWWSSRVERWWWYLASGQFST